MGTLRHPTGRIGHVPTDVEETPSFPRLMARTMRFTLGVPRELRVSPDGARVSFVRSSSGTERTGQLWVQDVITGDERLVVDPGVLLAQGEELLAPEERARRERMREGGAGVTAYSVDSAVTRAVFALSSRLFVADLARDAGVHEIPVDGPVVDPHVSPDGQWVAYAAAHGLHVVSIDGDEGRPLLEPDGEHVTWGLAEFIAAEEFGRFRGAWWSPDSRALLVARVDESPVTVWYVSDPAHPDVPPYEHRYPAAGTANADVSLWHVRLDGSRTEVPWDHEALPYLVDVSWTLDRPALVLLMDRRQSRQLLLAIDDDPAAPREQLEITDPSWVDVVPGTPCWWGERILTIEVHADTYRLFADGEAITPEGLQVRAVVDIDEDAVLIVGGEDDIERRPYLVHADGTLTPLGPERAMSSARRAGGTVVLRVDTLESPEPSFTLLRSEAEPTPGPAVLAADPGLRPTPVFVKPGRSQRTVVVLPRGWTAADGRLPVLMQPYGGPHHAEVTYAARSYLQAQWVADQGFAVVIGDGPGTPGAPSWERQMRFDFATPALEGQVAALNAAAEAFPDALDLTRVGIRGWSFGGLLAGLAVLHRPDVFHAAVAGAPVTEQRLYDTGYTERYLGLPQEHPEAYEGSSLIGLAPGLSRPLLIIHGLADDNVVIAHSLLLSSALLASGRPHSLLPLSGVTHMTSQEVVSENLLLLQIDFLRNALREPT
jgi:dipeptidyl-peptidase 4